jgi:hypothetical protein
MKPVGDLFMAALPKPKKSLRKFNDYVEVADKSLATSRTEEYTTPSWERPFRRASIR